MLNGSPLLWLFLLAVIGGLVFLGVRFRRGRRVQVRMLPARNRESQLTRAHPDVTKQAGPETTYVDRPQNNPAKTGRLASTVPLELKDVHAAEAAGASRAGLERIHQVLNGDADPLEAAWTTLKQLSPPPGQRHMALQTMDRLAKDLEAIGRFEVARDIYEHMADWEPTWPDIKNRLAFARLQAIEQLKQVRATPAAPTETSPGRLNKIGPYPVKGEIGRGAMGAVYLANDPVTGMKIALKTMALSQEFEGDSLSDARARFQREAAMAGRLRHPDIVHILDTGEDKGLAYIAMEYVDGTDLGFFAQPGRLLPIRQLLHIIARVAEALAYAHTQGVTHRDIKPANIMVDLEKGVVKVMDFGVARVTDAARTRTGVVLGTPSFMSPEQLSGQPVDGRSDLYSLGVTLFQLLTGQLPYQHTNMASLMRAIAQDTPPPVSQISPELPAQLDDIVALALQKHPNMRYSNGHQMAEDLRSI